MSEPAETNNQEEMSMEEILSSIKSIMMAGKQRQAQTAQQHENITEEGEVPLPSYPSDLEPQKDLNPAGTHGISSFPKFHEFKAPPAAEFLTKTGKVPEKMPLNEIEKLHDVAKEAPISGEQAIDDVVRRTRASQGAKSRAPEKDIDEIIQRSTKRIASMYEKERPKEDPTGMDTPQKIEGNSSKPIGPKELDFKALNFVRSQIKDKVNEDTSANFIKKYVATEFSPRIEGVPQKKAGPDREDTVAPKGGFSAEPEGYELKKIATKDVALSSYDEHHLLDRLFRQLLDHLVKDVIEKMANQWMKENMPSMVAKQTHTEFDKLIRKLKAD